ncbi:hypothetical protein CC80DRAFT_204343 [Byssothecium circinans]|uniref:Uncharacterized protein n=1 Tax=Byssothecium circinans TaxID=147558 RepID=A0A6A5TRM3_9PLEO|nr:hypothetical protein CC80DRAFT_204343 [Byssothecium circinans]
MKNMNEDFARQLALPCYMFNHAHAFSQVTKWLAYNFAGHITEKRPQGFKWTHMHLSPPDFVGPMNHARGGLKTTLHRGLWDKVGDLLENGPDCDDCDDWDSVAGRYFAELVRIAAYPLEKVFPKNSITAILQRLDDFSLGRIGDCEHCNTDWSYFIRRAIERTEDNFDGFCMDCMDASRPQRGPTDADYWKGLKSVGGRWDVKCRVRHGQQTWYVSWCGRDEHRQKLLKEAGAKRKCLPTAGMLDD